MVFGVEDVFIFVGFIIEGVMVIGDCQEVVIVGNVNVFFVKVWYVNFNLVLFSGFFNVGFYVVIVKWQVGVVKEVVVKLILYYVIKEVVVML